MEWNGEIIILSSIILILFAGFLFLLALIFIRRKNALLQEQISLKQSFEKELAESQLEIREETLRNISWELHDNIGQLMTLAKIQTQNAHQDPKKIDEAAEIIGNALTELRALSKSINPESLNSRDILESLKLEIDRFNRLKFIDAQLNVIGENFEISSKDQIILFRILQEFFSNTIRHSQATQLTLKLTYSKDQLNITSSDNGTGFNVDGIADGIGLKNMKKRAELIGAKLNLDSTPNQGTTLKIDYPKNSML